MRTFKDNADRTWQISVNADSVKRVRQECGIDLARPTADGCQLIGRLHDDCVLLAEVAWALVKPDAEAQSVTRQQSEAALRGDVLDLAFDAVTDSVCDFIPSRTVREALRTYIAKLKAAVGALAEDAARTVREFDIAAAMAKNAGPLN